MCAQSWPTLCDPYSGLQMKPKIETKYYKYSHLFLVSVGDWFQTPSPLPTSRIPKPKDASLLYRMVEYLQITYTHPPLYNCPWNNMGWNCTGPLTQESKAGWIHGYKELGKWRNCSRRPSISYTESFDCTEG